jgi:LPXTG-motif cell wall-anchored protein
VAEQKDATVVTTDDRGAAEFIGLQDGTYTLKEIEAPAGYNLLTDTIDITIAGSDADATTLTVEAAVANATGSQLPSTGGVGTTIFYTLGLMMMAVSALLLVAKKRMAKSE